MLPIVKITLPVAVLGVTVAVSVEFAPCTTEVGAAINDVVVAVVLATTWTLPEYTEAAKLESPL